jgi:deoxyhypusine synthase
MEKNDFLKDTVKHIDIKAFDSTEIIEAMKDMSFTARETARAAELFDMMIKDQECTVILCIAGSTKSGRAFRYDDKRPGVYRYSVYCRQYKCCRMHADLH